MDKVINKYYEIEIRNSLAIIFIKEDVFKLLISDDNELLFKDLHYLHDDPKIKALLFINTPECFGEKVYDNFLRGLNLTIDNTDYELPNFCNNTNRFRELNILNRFISYLTKYNKLIFTVLSGGIVTPFFAAALATDIRYATPEMHFSLAHNKYGLHPSGGLPYFLITQLGYNKAIELMLSEKVSSEEALELGLINKIYPSANVIESVIGDIEEITRHSSCTLRRTKQLSAYVRNSLYDYYKYEGALLNL